MTAILRPFVPLQSTYPRRTLTPYIWEVEDGYYDYTDETDNFSGRTFTSEAHAAKALDEYADSLNEPEFEAYVFDERIGSERIHLFKTETARDAFISRQPSWKMAH